MGRKEIAINPECGRRLKYWLTKVGFTAQELAAGIDYSPQYLSGIINGKRRMTHEFARAVEEWSFKKQFKESQDNGELTKQDELTVRAEWLMGRDPFMSLSDLLTREESDDEKREHEEQLLFDILERGFSSLGYTLRWRRYVDYPEINIMTWPIYDHVYFEVINDKSGEVEASFPGVILEQAAEQYMDFGKNLAQSIITRSSPSMKRRVKDGNAKMVHTQKAIAKEAEDNGESAGKKE